jgi:hypothetical protein
MKNIFLILALVILLPIASYGFEFSVGGGSRNISILTHTSITGILKGNGSLVSAATASSDYAPATSGSAILKGNGTGGFSSAAAGSDFVGVGGELVGDYYTSITSAVTGTGNINLDGTAAADYNYNNGASAATYTPVFTTLPSSGKVRYITFTFGGGAGVITKTWTNVNWIGSAGSAVTITNLKDTYACILRSTGAWCTAVYEGY